MGKCPRCKYPVSQVFWVFGDVWCGPCVTEVYGRLPEKGLTIEQIAASLKSDETQDSDQESGWTEGS